METKQKVILYNPLYEGKRWIENISRGLRIAGEAHEITTRLPLGYYVDQFCDETVRGLVVQLPARHGRPQYVAAVADPYNKDCALVDFADVTDDKADAARWADGMADRYADDAREFSAKDQAERDIEDAREEIKAAHDRHRELMRGLRVCDCPTAIGALRTEARRARSDAHNAIKTIRARMDNYWSAVDHY